MLVQRDTLILSRFFVFLLYIYWKSSSEKTTNPAEKYFNAEFSSALIVLSRPSMLAIQWGISRAILKNSRLLIIWRNLIGEPVSKISICLLLNTPIACNPCARRPFVASLLSSYLFLAKSIATEAFAAICSDASEYLSFIKPTAWVVLFLTSENVSLVLSWTEPARLVNFVPNLLTLSFKSSFSSLSTMSICSIFRVFYSLFKSTKFYLEIDFVTSRL